MNTRRVFSAFLALALLFSLVSSSIAQSTAPEGKSSASIYYPWDVDTFATDYAVTNIGVIYLTPAQYPFISYLKDGFLNIAHPAIGIAGNCGPGNTWVCEQLTYNIVAGSLSEPVLEKNELGEYGISWAFENDDHLIMVFTRLYSATLVPYGYIYGAVINLDDNVTLKGKPAIAWETATYTPEVVVALHRDDNIEYILYRHNSDTVNTTCGFNNSFQCDVIYSLGGPIILKPSAGFELTSANLPRITFQVNNPGGIYMMYAYPQADADYHPNCGPGNNTWRCITIMDNVETTANFDMAMGPSQPHVAFAKTDTLTVTSLYHARRVGSIGGNCGEDYVYNILSGSIVLTDTWKCTELATISYVPTAKDFSIQVDADNLPAIAYQDSSDIYANLRVFRGNLTGSWSDVEVENGGPGESNQGREIALALDENGMGFIGLIEDVPYEENVKIAYQLHAVYMPIIRR